MFDRDLIGPVEGLQDLIRIGKTPDTVIAIGTRTGRCVEVESRGGKLTKVISQRSLDHWIHLSCSIYFPHLESAHSAGRQ